MPTTRENNCVCGEPETPGITHRTDGPCFVTDSQQQERCSNPKCEHGWIVHSPSDYDRRHGESRRMHTPCPDCAAHPGKQGSGDTWPIEQTEPAPLPDHVRRQMADEYTDALMERLVDPGEQGGEQVDRLSTPPDKGGR